MTKIKLHEHDKEKTYFSMPVLCEAEQLESDQEISVQHGDNINAKKGDYIVSIQGVPQSLVEKAKFDQHYRKLNDMPDDIKKAIRKVLGWKLGISDAGNDSL